jgi:hypothetical protein
MSDAEIGVTSVSVVGSTTGDPAVTPVGAMIWVWTMDALSTTGAPVVMLDAVRLIPDGT